MRCLTETSQLRAVFLNRSFASKLQVDVFYWRAALIGARAVFLVTWRLFTLATAEKTSPSFRHSEMCLAGWFWRGYFGSEVTWERPWQVTSQTPANPTPPLWVCCCKVRTRHTAPGQEAESMFTQDEAPIHFIHMHPFLLLCCTFALHGPLLETCLKMFESTGSWNLAAFEPGTHLLAQVIRPYCEMIKGFSFTCVRPWNEEAELRQTDHL